MFQQDVKISWLGWLWLNLSFVFLFGLQGCGITAAANSSSEVPAEAPAGVLLEASTEASTETSAAAPVGTVDPLANSAASATPQKPVVILVPGFFNSILPGHSDEDGARSYFSNAILKTIASQGLVVRVVNNLLPTATVERNGELLERYLTAATNRFPGQRFLLIAHSAGGLYSMQALTRNPNLPVDTVLTLATPYGGVEFLDRIANNIPGVEWLLKYLPIEGLRQFRSQVMAGEIARLHVPERVRWIAVGGIQPPCTYLDCSRADKLSWLLSIAQRLMSEPSDGVVTLSSALGIGSKFKRPDGSLFEMERWTDFNFALEHWEMVEECNFFAALGVRDFSRIRRLQTQYFIELLGRVLPRGFQLNHEIRLQATVEGPDEVSIL